MQSNHNPSYRTNAPNTTAFNTQNDHAFTRTISLTPTKWSQHKTHARSRTVRINAEHHSEQHLALLPSSWQQQYGYDPASPLSPLTVFLFANSERFKTTGGELERIAKHRSRPRQRKTRVPPPTLRLSVENEIDLGFIYHPIRKEVNGVRGVHAGLG